MTISRESRHVRADPDQVRDALGLVRRSGVPDLLRNWRNDDRRRAGQVSRGGMPSWLSDEQVLTVLHLVTSSGHPQTVDSMASLILRGLDSESLTLLGLDTAGATFNEIRARVSRSLHRTLDVIDPHPGPKKLKQTFAELRRYELSLPDGLVEERKRRLLELTNALLAETYRAVPEQYRQRWQGNCCVDATFVQAFCGKGTPWASAIGDDDLVASEPFAGYYIRRKDHGVSGEDLRTMSRAERTKLGKISWGWETTLVVMAANFPDEVATFPLLVVGMNFHPPGISPGRHAIDALRRMHAAGMPASYLAGDRAYGPKPVTEDYAGPARELGYKLLWDLTEKETARTRRIQGALLLEGNLYCPAMAASEKLITATQDLRYGDAVNGRRITQAEYDQRVAQRGRYLLKPHGGIQPNGTGRFMCPAAGPAPTVTCPLRPREDPKTVGLWPIRTRELPDEHDRSALCTSISGVVTFKATSRFPRLIQDKQYGTPEWLAWYTTLRQSIESFNSYLKLGTATAMHIADRRRVRGFAAANLFVAMDVVAINLRKTERWLQDPVPVDAKGRGPTKAQKERRREKLGYGPRLPRDRGTR
ncbi:MAG: hypothetical protein QM779_13915 [Propionicimonas sp.]|uniref:hypothetical protein n=1 Tax=Propionicimonas sp. TaxID=1955623 RepID=UPI003D12C1D4